MTDRIRETQLEVMQRYGFGHDAMKKIKICSCCGTSSPDVQYYCRECGTKLPEDTLYQSYKRRCRYCTQCDTILSPAAQYCPSCGKKLWIT